MGEAEAVSRGRQHWSNTEGRSHVSWTPRSGGTPALAQPFPEFPPCSPETTTSTTSSLAPPPTTKICDPGELGSGGAASAPSFVSVPVTLALAAAAATASRLLIW